MTKSVIVLSGGLDSTYNLLKALETSEVILALTFDYGQRAKDREITTAIALCRSYGISHQCIELPWFSFFTQTALVVRHQDLPQGKELSLDDIKTSTESAQRVWVPNRNGIFINVAAGFAEGLNADAIVVGFNREEAATFPDNSAEYVSAATSALTYSTANSVKIICHSIEKTKTEMVAELKALNFDFASVWPCYQGFQRPCGVCESCERYARALKNNAMSWPW